MNQHWPTAAVDPQALRLTVLLQLEQRIRGAATVEELRFILVNEPHALLPYRQAALAVPTGAGWRTVALSGVALPDRQAPFVQFLDRLLPALVAGDAVVSPVRPDLVPAETEEWRSWWQDASVLRVPLLHRGQMVGLLLLIRDGWWQDSEGGLAALLGDAAGHALVALQQRQRRSWLPRRKRLLAAGAVALLVLSVLPVRESVIGTAELVARRPLLARAPYDGVIETVDVQPNQMVNAGDRLFSLHLDKVTADLAVALSALEVAETEQRQASQLAFTDPQAKANLAGLQGRIEQRRAEVAYLQQLLERLVVVAPRAGVAIFDDANDWIGRPVRTGERVIQIADPNDVQLEIRVPADDAVRLEVGAEARLFLNLAPDRAVDAKITRVAYGMSKGPEGYLVHRLKADVVPHASTDLRLGLKGTAKVYGRSVPLGFYVLRRPIGVVRQWLGL